MKYIINVHNDDVNKFEHYFGGAVEIVPSRRNLAQRRVRITSIDRLGSHALDQKDYGYDIQDMIRGSLALQDFIQDKNDEIARLEAQIDDLKIELAQLKRTGPFELTGPEVYVYAPDSGVPLFTGRELPGVAPWQYWHRVVPDNGYVDLPPAYRIENVS